MNAYLWMADCIGFALSATAATEIPVGEFRSLQLSNGGHVKRHREAVIILIDGVLARRAVESAIASARKSLLTTAAARATRHIG